MDLDLPPRFPQTPEAAVAMCGVVGVPDDFVVTTWEQAVARGGRDSKGCAILHFPAHVSVSWKYQRARAEEHKAGNGNGSGPAKSESVWSLGKRKEAAIERRDALRFKFAIDTGSGWSWRTETPEGKAALAEAKRLGKLITDLTAEIANAERDGT